MDFLEVLERTEAEAFDLRAAFSSNSEEGSAIRATRLVRSPQYKKKLAEATRFVSGLIKGSIAPYRLREVMTTDDFPILFGDILDRTLLAAYQEWPVTWTAVAKRVLLNDFRDAKVFLPVYGAGGVLDEVPQSSQYPADRLYEQEPFTWHVTKYGRRVPFSWETMINDDMDQLKSVPEALGRAARRTEHSLVTNLYVDANGPHASLYTSGNKNQVIKANGAANDNPALGVAGLADAYLVLNSMLNEEGFPILRDAVTLVVPPALEITARTILNATQLMGTVAAMGGTPDDGSGSGYQRVVADNWMRNKLTLVVDPYIPTIASSSNGATSWFLFANPNTSREAMRIGFLRGHEAPEIWMKSPNAMRVGGGAVGAMDGDFETDGIQYRVRHVTGVVRVDPKATVASDGSGSA